MLSTTQNRGPSKMNLRYKIILSNNNFYKEIELTEDLQQIKVGTGVDCDVRLRKELFFGQVELVFARNNEAWSVMCSDNLMACILMDRGL